MILATCQCHILSYIPSICCTKSSYGSPFQNNRTQPSGNIRDAYRKMFDFFLRAVAEK